MRRIRKAAVLGSGVMGSGIAAHLANIGVEVLMLDIVPRDLPEDKKNDLAARNSIAQGALMKAIKGKPAPFYERDMASRITVGNFDDHMKDIKDCDWVIEVVVENLDIKKKVFAQVEAHRKAGSLITSNTSSIPIHMMAEGRSEDFKKHFCGTHFFNPVRYMRLLEIIPTPDTDPAVTDFLMEYGDTYLGKQTVLCKDTPAFIANRIGVYSGMKLSELTDKHDLRIEEVDALTGPAIARPKTGTYRLQDLVGLDTNDKVVNFVKSAATEDEYLSVIRDQGNPTYVDYLLKNKFYGNKSGQGFYKRTNEKDEKGRRIIYALNLKTLEYEPSQRPNIPSVKSAKQIDDPAYRVRAMLDAKDKGGDFLREYFGGLFAYSANRIPEISDDVYSIDDAMRTGYAWEMGPFEYWDAYGLQKGIDLAKQYDEKVPSWIHEMVDAGHESFYKLEDGKRKYYDLASKSYHEVPSSADFIILDAYRDQSPVFRNSEVTLHDIGDGVLCLEFRSKANSMGEGVLRGMNESIRIAEEGDWKGLVIGNNSTNFSVGANLMMMAQLAYQQEWDEMNMAVNLFQQTTMRCRYSAIPVVAATQGYVFGGGCETIMHCDATMAASESYIGLVEVGVGILPAGGGTKELALRASDQFFEGDVMIPTLIDKFRTIAMASVATSAHEAFSKGYLLDTKDEVVMNAKRNISEAKQKVLELADNYTQPIIREDIMVLGRTGLAALYAAANELYRGKYASEHDIKIAKKIAYVLCGGDLTGTPKVSEQYLLDIEREAMLSLVAEPKTMERIQHMLTTNKPLRN
ncbi:MAG: 3-hydroxyacyl-CoA dehydrogenase NAD-binding domain-containing protein [Bacteroidota bacterium]